MAIIFKPTELVIFITAPQTSVNIQSLVNAIRNWEDSPEGIVWPEVCNASGKNPIPGGSVGITLELINDWRIQFEPRPGPNWVRCEVLGGNLTATNSYGNNPIKDSAYVNTMISQSTSPALVYASGGSPEDIADAVWNELPAGHTDAGKAGAQLWTVVDSIGTNVAAVGAMAAFIKCALTNRMPWDDVAKRWDIWDDTGTVILYHMQPYDANGNLITPMAGQIFQRTKVAP